MDYCSHPRTEIRWRIIAGGARVIQSQCIDCGLSVGGAISQRDKTQAYLESLEKWDDSLTQRTRTKWEEQRDRIASESAAKSKEWWQWYNEYLKSPKWLYKRDRVLERDKYICRGCLEAPATQVHHLTYEHVGDELLFELESVCKPCHDRVHAPNPHSSGAPKL